MKKVRFVSPVKAFNLRMEESECHSPRPFMEKNDICPNVLPSFPKILPYSPDPVDRFENSNSCPYPTIHKTTLINSNSQWSPSNDLDLSMLDNSYYVEPRKPLIYKTLQNKDKENFSCAINNQAQNTASGFVTSSTKNVGDVTSDQSGICSNFFIRRQQSENMLPFRNHFDRLSLSKEDVILSKKEQMKRPFVKAGSGDSSCMEIAAGMLKPTCCSCHHCKIIPSKIHPRISVLQEKNRMHKYSKPSNHNRSKLEQSCDCKKIVQLPQNIQKSCCEHCVKRYDQKNTNSLSHDSNVVDKRTWILERYNNQNENNIMEIDKQNNITTEQNEPTVADLFKIIKLQSEQLQLLQEKVDKFLSVNANKSIPAVQSNNLPEQVAIKSATSEHKMSIGVMTSFEMVKTSTIINQEIVTQTNENTQIQCNKSQISIKEVVTKTQPVNPNFLDGITPISESGRVRTENLTNQQVTEGQTDLLNDDKTLNELSLYNVQVDSATTPNISPEQSLYLDVRDYSDSDSDVDQSNVGWTYYNKVMTHVNGMLHDSDMPSSASAMCRNTRQECVQMQFDKTNISVTKRVKFGDDPFGVYQPHIYAGSTETSLKMNELAAKYLQGSMQRPQYPLPVAKPAIMPIDMSYATRNYMERHKILQGNSVPGQSAPANEMPRFLDITALKQQPKLL